MSNPILSREFQGRWRDRRAFWLLFLLTLALSLAACFAYHRAFTFAQWSLQYETQSGTYAPNSPMAFGQPQYYFDQNDVLYYFDGQRYILVPTVFSLPQPYNPNRFGFGATTVNLPKTSQVGRELFRMFVLVNIAIWLILSAAIAATSIARERERGLLESLQLSPMLPRSQILARLGAILLFLAVLQIATVPAYSTAFLMGGISPSEIGWAILAVALTGLWGASLGLWFSSRASRPSGALWSVLALLFCWSLVSYTVWKGGLWHWMAMPRFVDWWQLGYEYTLLVSLNLHPVFAFWAWSDPNSGMREALLSDSNALTLGLLGLGVLGSGLLLKLASRNINRILPPPQWGTRNRFVERWKKQIEAQKAAREAEIARQSTKDAVSQALVADLPIEKLVRFRHPILAREVRARFRLRRVGRWASLGRLALVLVCGMVWAYAVFNLIWPDINEFASAILMFLWFAGSVGVALLSSSSFAREREGGTWEGMRLALFSPTEIVGAKWLSPILSAIYYLAPIWMLLPFYAWRLPHHATAIAFSVVVILASWSFSSVVGLLVSWRAPSPTAATCWTLGLIAALFFGPMFLGNTDWSPAALLPDFFSSRATRPSPSPSSEGVSTFLREGVSERFVGQMMAAVIAPLGALMLLRAWIVRENRGL